MSVGLKSLFEENTRHLRDRHFMVAVSGGRDSMVLAELFYESGISFSVGHINYVLRTQALEESKLIKKWCNSRSIKLNISFQPLCGSSNIQSKARDYRREKLQEWSLDKSSIITMAHHEEDQLETFFLQAMRGSGTSGLRGMTSDPQHIFRPLLNAPGETIGRFAEQAEIEYLNDESNSENYYSRNMLRNEVFPILFEGEMEGKRKRGVLNAIKIQNKTENFLRYMESMALAKCTRFGDALVFDNISEMHPFILSRILLKLGFNIQDIETCIGQLAQPGAIFLSDSYTMQSVEDQLWIATNDFDKVPYSIETPSELSRIFSIKEKASNLTQNDKCSQIHIYPECLEWPLTYRLWESNDQIIRLGMNGHRQKVKKILTDKKCPKLLRSRVRVLTDAKEKIIWIPNYAIADHRSTKVDKNVLSLCLSSIQDDQKHPF